MSDKAVKSAEESGLLALRAGRLARTVTIATFAVVPIHWFVSCDGSGVVMVLAAWLFAAIGVLCVLTRNLRLFLLAVAAFVLNSMCVH